MMTGNDHARPETRPGVFNKCNLPGPERAIPIPRWPHASVDVQRVARYPRARRLPSCARGPNGEESLGCTLHISIAHCTDKHQEPGQGGPQAESLALDAAQGARSGVGAEP